jgi:hypothetical protein
VYAISKEVEDLSETGNETAVRQQTRKIGILSMGITLIAAGVLMLCAQMGWLDLSGYRWLLPAYLIVLGAETLITRLFLNRKDPQVRLVPSVGSVAITLGVLFFAQLWGVLAVQGIHSWMYW